MSSSQLGIVAEDTTGSDGTEGGSEGDESGGSDPSDGPTVEWEGKLGTPFMVAPD